MWIKQRQFHYLIHLSRSLHQIKTIHELSCSRITTIAHFIPIYRDHMKQLLIYFQPVRPEFFFPFSYPTFWDRSPTPHTWYPIPLPPSEYFSCRVYRRGHVPVEPDPPYIYQKAV